MGCNNHKLSFEVNEMIRNYSEPSSVIDSIQGTIKDVTTKLKSAALIINATELDPVIWR